MTTRRPNWGAVALFFVVACLWSWAAARWGALHFPVGDTTLRIDDSILVGFGPAAGAMAALLVTRRRPDIVTFLGQSPRTALLALLAPIILVAAFGLAKPHLGPHVDGFTFALTVVIYCIGEELGWRGWLHDELASLKTWQVAVITAPLWYAWHWTFLADLYDSLQFAAGFAALVAVASFGLAQAVRRTRSVAVAVAWHAAAKMLFWPAQIALMIAAIAYATWAGGRRTR
ncbi:CPBP family glutamic-type intramembrane protease [Glacieibacterium frigidum]|uniref:CPBP family intramembrane metalloprotease n=1 Tax=Glacieibacterium frigidum TaxID=2593303 RepID=A0A552UHV2_9SPHN|nr:CPBP family glutamic-type intramembrane protease [Glacieibacterium frigidum]TRW17799.1 CPBP family intramembrane metalloprotease [Glacieibacterium frigidum]